MPEPVSVTSMRISSPARLARSVTRPGADECLNAFAEEADQNLAQQHPISLGGEIRLDLDLEADSIGRDERLGRLLAGDRDIEHLGARSRRPIRSSRASGGSRSGE